MKLKNKLVTTPNIGNVCAVASFDDKDYVTHLGQYALGSHVLLQTQHGRSYLYADNGMEAPLVQSVLEGFPLDTITVANIDGATVLVDGHQRLGALVRYLHNKFAVEIDGVPKKFDELTPEQQSALHDYELVLVSYDADDYESIAQLFATKNAH